MRLLYLDLATKTGWASGDIGSDPTYGVMRLPSTGDDVGEFAGAFDLWLRKKVADDQPELVVFEAPIVVVGKTSRKVARKLMGLAWHVEFICGELDLECAEVNLSSVKKFFGGHGKSDKAQMIHIARRYGWAPADDNDADALAGWAYSAFKIDPKAARRFELGALGGGAGKVL